MLMLFCLNYRKLTWFMIAFLNKRVKKQWYVFMFVTILKKIILILLSCLAATCTKSHVWRRHALLLFLQTPILALLLRDTLLPSPLEHTSSLNLLCFPISVQLLQPRAACRAGLLIQFLSPDVERHKIRNLLLKKSNFLGKAAKSGTKQHRCPLQPRGTSKEERGKRKIWQEIQTMSQPISLFLVASLSGRTGLNSLLLKRNNGRNNGSRRSITSNTQFFLKHWPVFVPVQRHVIKQNHFHFLMMKQKSIVEQMVKITKKSWFLSLLLLLCKSSTRIIVCLFYQIGWMLISIGIRTS